MRFHWVPTGSPRLPVPRHRHEPGVYLQARTLQRGYVPVPTNHQANYACSFIAPRRRRHAAGSSATTLPAAASSTPGAGGIGLESPLSACVWDGDHAHHLDTTPRAGFVPTFFQLWPTHHLFQCSTVAMPCNVGTGYTGTALRRLPVPDAATYTDTVTVSTASGGLLSSHAGTRLVATRAALLHAHAACYATTCPTAHAAAPHDHTRQSRHFQT
jgi:hypothetical protein